MEKYKLLNPKNYNGELITEIELDFEKLTVADLERCEKQARAMLDKREFMSTPETNKKYLSCVVAKAAGVKLDLIRSLAGNDYTQVCVLAQNFLLGGDSDLTEEENDETNTSSEPTMTDTQKTSQYSMESLPDYLDYKNQ